MRRAGPRERVVVWAALVVVAGGCAPPGVRRPAPVAQVDNITLLAMPAPAHLDSRPGADGLRIDALYFFQADKPDPVLVDGALKVMMYQDAAGPELSDAEPLHTWEFSSGELERMAVRKTIGWGYQLLLPWGNRPPRPNTRRLTLVVQYAPPQGRPVYSAPTSLFVGS